MSDLIQEFPLFISKSSLQDGEMRWAAVNSDTSTDLYGEKMTLGLYQKMLARIEQELPPPEEFRSMVCSEYWCGGIPYVSIAHYSDGNGKAVPGETLEIFIDGNQLKAKGILYDTPLGRAVWKSLKEDELNYKNQVDAERIRISIAFLDLAHKHGDNGIVFVRESLKSVCPECQKGAGNKIYVDGYLVHLALTRKPVNPRTIIQAEDNAMAKKSIVTRKDDALSIVQDESLVEEVVEAALTSKSDALVEMSDTPVVEESKKMDSSKEDEKYPKDMEEDKMEKEESKTGKKKCSLTDGDVEIIRNLIVEAMPKPADIVIQPITEPVLTKSTLDLATDDLYTSVNTALGMKGVTLEQRLESINPALQEVGNAITALVRESLGQAAPAPVSNDQSMILEALSTLTSKIDGFSQELALVKEKSLVPSAPVQNRVPVPRSIQPQLVTQSQTQPTNPNSVRNLVRRSVGIQE